MTGFTLTSLEWLTTVMRYPIYPRAWLEDPAGIPNNLYTSPGITINRRKLFLGLLRNFCYEFMPMTRKSMSIIFLIN
jgi:hypothetical protein